MQDPTSRPEADAFDFPEIPFLPEEVMAVLDAGSAYADGKPPATISFAGKAIPNYRKDEPPITLLGAAQKAWFKRTMAASKATWKIWGASNGTLDWRVDPQNLPKGLTNPWPGDGYACFGGGDLSGIHTERAELYDFIRDQKIAGFVTVSGDRHSFWAGYAAKALPPKEFEPVGVVFIGGSLSSPGLAEASEHRPKDHPLSPLFVAERPGGKFETTINLTLKHGVRSALEFARSGDLAAARRLSNPANAPHLEFIDMGGHGYSVGTHGDRNRIRLHSTADCAFEDARRRPDPLSRAAHDSAVDCGDAPGDGATDHRRRGGIGGVNRHVVQLSLTARQRFDRLRTPRAISFVAVLRRLPAQSVQTLEPISTPGSSHPARATCNAVSVEVDAILGG
jgi:hypothetical protein